jgi:hypothetical protein
MAFNATIIQPVSQPSSSSQPLVATDATLLSMLVLSVYAASKSKKEFRKLKRRFLWTAFKLRIQSVFAPKKAATERRVILYVLIGILALILIFYAPIAALIVALIGLILYLSGVI